LIAYVKKGYLYINTIDFNIHSNDGINFDFKSTPKIDLENLGINVKPNNTNNIFLNNYITTERNAYQTGARIYTIENSGEGKMTLTIKIDNNIILNKAFYEKIDAPDVMFRNNTDPGDSESATKVICERLYQKYHEALLDFFTTKCGYSVGLFSDLEKSDQPDLDVFLIDAGHQNTYRNKDFSNNIKNVLKNCILNNDIPYDIRINAYCILNNTVLYISNDKYNDDRKILEWISREKKENIYSTCIVGLSNHLDCIEYLKIKEWKPKDSFELNYHNAVHDKFKKCSSIILLQLCRTNYRYNGFQENIKEVLWDRFHRHDLNFAPTKTKAI
jgi:hypothetical protein